MNYSMKKYIPLFAILFIVIVLLFAGNADFNQTVIYNMSDKVYKKVLTDLGGCATESEIVKTYMSNQSYYDSIK